MTKRLASDAKVSQLARGLETLHTRSPTQIRTRILQAIFQAGESDGAYLVSTGMVDGNLAVQSWQAMGDEALDRFHRDVLQIPPAELQVLLEEDPALLTPKPIELRAFTEDSMMYSRERFERTQYYQKCHVPYGIYSLQHLRIFQGLSYLGFVGFMRKKGATPFSSRERHRLAPLVRSTLSAFTLAAALESQDLPEGPAHLVVKPTGEVEYASIGAKAWLSREGFPETLKQTVVSLDRQKYIALSAPLQQASARFVRMDGEGKVSYLVTLTAAKPLVLSAYHLLSPTQQKVAQYAVVGATVEEISKATGQQPETVRTHIKRIYQRLGVASRLELARVLQRKPDGDLILT